MTPLPGLTLHYRVDTAYLYAKLLCTRAGSGGSWLGMGFATTPGVMVGATAVIGQNVPFGAMSMSMVGSGAVAMFDLNEYAILVEKDVVLAMLCIFMFLALLFLPELPP